MNGKNSFLVLLVLVYTGLSYIISKLHASFENKHTNSNETFKPEIFTNHNNADHFVKSCLINRASYLLGLSVWFEDISGSLSSGKSFITN